jgi:hypothetical protein
VLKYYKAFFLLLFIANSISAQQRDLKLLRGKVVSNTYDLGGINVVNTRDDSFVLTLQNGFFQIKAAVGDTLVFSAVQFKGIKVKLKQSDFDRDIFEVNLQVKVTELDEVIIDENKISAVSLGIVSKNQKKYTPAERKLYTATTGAGLVSFDAILNAISGRTKMLKKELALEKNGIVMQKITNWFEDSYFIDKLKIPADYVNGFKYYIVDDRSLVDAVNARNKTLTTFIMGNLAEKYLKLLNEK